MKRPKFTYANVVATLALFLALGGVSWAVVKIPKNSVGTAQLRNNAVNSAKVKDGSLTAKDMKSGQLFRPGGMTVRVSGGVAITGSGSFFTTVATLPVPRGNYAVMATTKLVNTLGLPTAICQISGTGAGVDGDSAQAIHPDSASPYPVALMSVIRMPAAGNIVLSCNKTVSGSISAYESRLLAVQVASASVSGS